MLESLKKNIDKLPILILGIILTHMFYLTYTTNATLVIKNYLAIALFIFLTAFSFFNNQNYRKITILVLILGSFNLIAFHLNSQHIGFGFKSEDGEFIGIRMQPNSFYVLLITTICFFTSREKKKNILDEKINHAMPSKPEFD